MLGKYIKDANSWTKGAYARDKYGNNCNIDSHNACKYCLSGALSADGHHLDKEYMRLHKIIEKYVAENDKYKDSFDDVLGVNIPGFNDHELTTWEDIKEVIRRFDSHAE